MADSTIDSERVFVNGFAIIVHDDNGMIFFWKEHDAFFLFADVDAQGDVFVNVAFVDQVFFTFVAFGAW